MGKEIITFGDIEVEKHKFYHCKNLILLEDIKIQVQCDFFRRKKFEIFY